MNRRIVMSSLSIFASAALVAGATFAFFSDTETSEGNTFAAGAIDLTIDNTSYLNGIYNSATSWLQPTDLDDELFFAFEDLKPGDNGEDTISLHVDSNDAWACMDVALTSNDDNGLTEPEEDDGDTTGNAGEGELAEAVNFIWWPDDGDNVLEDDEVGSVESSSSLGEGTIKLTLADSGASLFSSADLSQEPLTEGALNGLETYYVGKGWCFGAVDTSNPVVQDDQGPVGTPGTEGSNGPDQRGTGFTCDGSDENDVTHTDSLTADVTFRAEQARNNDDFQCEQEPSPTP